MVPLSAHDGLPKHHVLPPRRGDVSAWIVAGVVAVVIGGLLAAMAIAEGYAAGLARRDAGNWTGPVALIGIALFCGGLLAIFAPRSARRGR